jgi:hypothetical protein
MEVPKQGSRRPACLLTHRQNVGQIHRPPKAFLFQMESHAMRNRLHISFGGIHLTAEGIVAIATAVLIVGAVLLASRL